MKNAEYWKQRFTQLEESSHRKTEDMFEVIEDSYMAAQQQLEADISKWYNRFAANNGLTMAEAKKQLNSRDLKEFHWTVEEYIKHGQENGITADWSKELENASARWHVNRYEALLYQIQNSLEVFYGGQNDALDAHLKNAYLDHYKHTIFEIQKGVGIAWDIAQPNLKALETVIKKPWNVDQRNFSERIWSNKAGMINELHKQLTQNLMLGRDPGKSVDLIMQKFGVARYQAARLVYTESAYIEAVAQENAYKALGIKQYEIIATLDDRTSDICRELDGTIFNMTDYNPGETAPPFHPWCRSVTAPYYKDLDGIGERAARDPNIGKTYYVPRSTKYKDWESSFNPAPIPIQPAPTTAPAPKPIVNTNQFPEITDPKLIQFETAVGKSLQQSGVKYHKVEKHQGARTEEEIIQALGGGDLTEGSCASLTFAFVGNNAGYDVLDFRGGESRHAFSLKANSLEIAKLPGMESYVYTGKNDIRAAHELMQNMIIGKKYYIGIGSHASVIRKTDTGYEYLELQSSEKNGWKPLNDDVFKWRFRCKQRRTYELTSKMVEIESMGKNEEFIRLLGFINTPANEQMKGSKGNVK